MKKTRRKTIYGVLFATVLLLALVMMAGCGGGSDSLVGTWERMGPSATTYNMSMELFSNGNFVKRWNTEQWSGTWEVSDGTLFMNMTGGGQAHATYELDGDSLRLRGFASPWGGTWTRR